MGKIPKRRLLLLLCIFSIVGIANILNHVRLTIPEKTFLWLLIIGLAGSFLIVGFGRKFRRRAGYTFNDSTGQLTGDPEQWVKKGLIPPTKVIYLWRVLSPESDKAVETLNIRSTNRNVTVWTLNSLMSKTFPRIRNKDWRMYPKSPVQIDYGIGRTKMVYYVKITKIRIPILIVSVSWNGDFPIFSFHGILSRRVSRIWKNFLETVNSKSEST
jgi:hypothetical protein